MHAVHVWHYHERAQHPVPSLWHGQVAVVEQNGQIQQCLEEDQLGKAHPQQDDDGQSNKSGQDKLAGMEAERRGCIHLDVRVVGLF